MTPSERYLEPEPGTENAVIRCHIHVTESGNRKLRLDIFQRTPKTSIRTVKRLVPSTTTFLIPNSLGYIRQSQSIMREVETQEEYEDGYTVSIPHSWRACRFIEARFKHGFRKLASEPNMLRYEVPLTDYSIALLKSAWKGILEKGPSCEDDFRRLTGRDVEGIWNAERVAEFRLRNKVPSSAWTIEHDAFLASRDITLSPYQKTAAFNAIQSNKYGLFMDPGTGKTCIMIRKLDHVLDNIPAGRIGTILIQCPASVRSNWQAELELFSRQVSSGTAFVHILNGADPVKRICNFFEDMQNHLGKHIIIITGYESFVKTPKLHNLEYDLLLDDESHNFANPGTKRVKCNLELAYKGKFSHVMLATGTPFRNSPFDLYAQLELFGEGFSGFESYAQFKAFYGEFTNGYNGRVDLTGYCMERIPLLQEKIAKHCFCITKEEALPHLPQKTFSIKECSMSPEQYKVYKQLLNELAAVIDTYGPNPDSMTVNNILTQMLRLEQITAGYAVADSGAVNRFDPNPKLELLMQHLGVTSNGTNDDSDDESEQGSEGTLTNPKRKTIVWVHEKEALRIISARLRLDRVQHVVYHGELDQEQRTHAVNQFNCNPECRVLVGTYQAGGTGLNLVGFDPQNPSQYDTNCDNIVFYSINWRQVDWRQATDRAHRHNTRVPVHVCSLLIPSSIDTEIYARVQGKIEMSNTMQDVRSILAKILPRL